MVPGLSIKPNVLNQEQIQIVHDLIARQPEHNWVHKDRIASERGVGNDLANYDLLFDRVLTDNDRAILRTLVPIFPDAVLQTQVINRYPIGGFLCDHTDRQLAKYNTVIPLQSNGDGLRYYIKNEDTGVLEKHFLKDRAGDMLIMTNAHLIHGVPLVTTLRYTLISIYTSPEEAAWDRFEGMYQS